MVISNKHWSISSSKHVNCGFVIIRGPRFRGISLKHSSKDNIKVRGSTQQQKFVFNELNSIKKSHWSTGLPKYANYFREFFEIFSEEFKVKIAVLLSMFVCFCWVIYPKFFTKALYMCHSNARLLTILITPFLESF